MKALNILASVGIIGIIYLLYWMYFEEVGSIIGTMVIFIIFSWILSKAKIVDDFEIKTLIRTYLGFVGFFWLIAFLYGFVLGLVFGF